MSAANRLALAGGLVALAEGAAGASALVAFGPERISLFLIACGVATATMAALVRALVSRQEPDGPGPGSSGPGAGDPPPSPPWWPGFERDFWQHVRRGERTPV